MYTEKVSSWMHPSNNSLRALDQFLRVAVSVSGKYREALSMRLLRVLWVIVAVPCNEVRIFTLLYFRIWLGQMRSLLHCIVGRSIREGGLLKSFLRDTRTLQAGWIGRGRS